MFHKKTSFLVLYISISIYHIIYIYIIILLYRYYIYIYIYISYIHTYNKIQYIATVFSRNKTIGKIKMESSKSKIDSSIIEVTKKKQMGTIVSYM